MTRDYPKIALRVFPWLLSDATAPIEASSDVGGRRRKRRRPRRGTPVDPAKPGHGWRWVQVGEREVAVHCSSARINRKGDVRPMVRFVTEPVYRLVWRER